ncbi:MAG: AMP-binding protein [Hyphomicrobiales bacterium]|nr:AMP-binding protein [Hyphomicrobiales bacterium]MBV8824270.1 AMP-binding protein [Hyphomicrobiales bacterium]MBV9428574.1 AMP-binding protein [Bradyrhizobiaceae bacterium]
MSIAQQIVAPVASSACTARAAFRPPCANATPAQLAAEVTRHFARRAGEPVLIHYNEYGRRAVTGTDMAKAIELAVAQFEAKRATGARTVILQLGNKPEFIVYLMACWLSGLVPLPMSPTYTTEYIIGRLSQRIAGPVLTVRAGAAGERPCPATIEIIAYRPGKGCAAGERWGYALPTGGTEGNPRICPVPDEDVAKSLHGLAAIADTAGWRAGQVQGVFGALDHAASFRFLLLGLRDRNLIVLTDLPDAERLVDVMLDERIGWTHLTPVQMAPMARAPRFRELGSAAWISGILHTSARCPRPLKRAWIDVLGADRVTELYSFTEMAGATIISGRNWLDHPGSVGKGFATQVRVLDDNGAALPAFEVGRVFLRSGLSRSLKHSFMVSGVEMTPSGYYFLGDYGWVDEDGFLYICGIRERIVDDAGKPIYVDVIEDCIVDAGGVADVCITVCSRRTGDAGMVAHIVPGPGVRAADALASARSACADALARSMWPDLWKAHKAFPRSTAGKVVRAQLSKQVADAELAGPQ